MLDATPKASSAQAPASVTIDTPALDAMLADESLAGPYPPDLVLDLRRADWIAIDALFYLMSVLVDRRDRGLLTSIALPTGPSWGRVFHFLRGWLFPEAVQDTLSLPSIESVLTRTSWAAYLRHRNAFPEPKYLGGSARPDLGRLLSSKYFGIQSFPPSSPDQTDDDITEHSNSWHVDRVKNILVNVLGRNVAGLVASTVVFESLLNARRHPGARFIETVSQLLSPHDDPDESPVPSVGQLHYVCWDDGTGITTTLKRAIDAGSRVCGVVSPELRRVFVITEEGREETTRIVMSDTIPGPSSSDVDLLLATFFPGVTCDVQGTNHKISDDLRNALTRAAEKTGLDVLAHPEVFGPGMGLFLLLNTATDVAQGSISVRTGDLFMQVTSASEYWRREGVHYEVAVHRVPPHVPAFRGNMLTIVAKAGL